MELMELLYLNCMFRNNKIFILKNRDFLRGHIGFVISDIAKMLH
jgi:hypothetical protein